MSEHYANRYQTALSGGINNSTTTIIVGSATGIPSTPFRAIISAEGANTAEIVRVTGASSTTLTVTRAAESIAGSSSASAHASGATFTAIVTAAALEAMVAPAVTSYTTSLTAAQLLTALADETIDVIELAGGTYHLATVSITTPRKRPIIVRPAAGATVVLAGNNSADGQFYFGLSGRAANITMQDFTLDSWSLSQTGLFWIGDAHDITLNRMTVTNSTGVSPATSWGLYVSQLDDKGSHDITADGWTITGSARSMSGMQVTQSSLRSRIRAREWTVSHLAYALYCSAYAEILDFDGWTISDCGIAGIAVFFEAYSGQTLTGAYRNIVGTTTDRIVNTSTGMIDGGGNTAMATTVPLYLHAATTAVGGSLPGAGGVAGDGDASATGVNTNRVMNTAIGVSQTSVSITSLATTGTQNLRMARFISPPLQAQTFAAQDIRVHVGAAQSSANAGWAPGFQLFIWRPSNGTRIASLVTGPRDTTPAPTTTNEFNAVTNTFTSTSGTAIAGDVLVLELWGNGRQSDNGTYTDTLYYDGTITDSTLSNAAYLDIPNGVLFQ